MKQIIIRDIHFLYSKKNRLFPLILILAMTLPLIFIGISNQDYLYTILGMNLEVLDKRYAIWILIFHFYIIWLGNTLFLKDLKCSCEFLWLRMQPKHWLFYKFFSLYIIFILTDSFIGLALFIYGPIFWTSIMSFLKIILITSIIQLFVTTFVIMGISYFQKGIIYLTLIIYIGAIYLKLPGCNLLFTSTIIHIPYMIIVLIFLISIFYYFIARKILLLTEGSIKHD